MVSRCSDVRWRVQEEPEELKTQVLNSYRLTAKKELTRILGRRQVIEERKEQLENISDMRVSVLNGSQGW